MNAPGAPETASLTVLFISLPLAMFERRDMLWAVTLIQVFRSLIGRKGLVYEQEERTESSLGLRSKQRRG